MAEIGATLREARMRARTDISEVETQTKIRAKYLRALENEEWDLLPGPTYVKSFLRTYADALGLDGKRLVEEYKLQHERLSDVELQPIAPPGSRDRRRRARLGRGWVIVVAVVALVAALYALGRGSSTDDDTAGSSATTTTPPATTTQARQKRRHHRATPATPKRVRLKLTPTAPVWVCLVAADGTPLIPGATLEPGSPTQTFRSKRMTMTLGNSSLTMTVNGRTTEVPSSTEPLGFELRPGKGLQPLPAGQGPTCGQ